MIGISIIGSSEMLLHVFDDGFFVEFRAAEERRIYLGETERITSALSRRREAVVDLPPVEITAIEVLSGRFAEDAGERGGRTIVAEQGA
jgi:hypothetical protein